MQFTEILTGADDFLWGGPLALLILSLGIYLSFKLRFLQFTRLREAFSCLFQKSNTAKGEISPFAALCTTLSATIGTGNIIGVATAIMSGGPGALLWMLVSAFFGMAIKYSEGYLAVKYRVTEKGKTFGGPFYYIENGLGKAFKPLSLFFACSCVFASVLGMGTLTQSNSIAEAVTNFFPYYDNSEFIKFGNVGFSSLTVTCAVLTTILSGAVILGGIKRISRIAEVIVPPMAIFYVSMCLVIIIGHAEKLPGAIYMIIKTAFSPEAVFGAAFGITFREALKMGISGGVFSNEAGLGTSPIADASAKTDSPDRQGLIAMTATFIDTFLICTLTGLSVLVTDSFENAESGASAAASMFRNGLLGGGEISVLLLTICLVLFAFTTIIGWNYYGEASLAYITGGSTKAIKIYRFFYILAVFLGPFISVPTVWTLARVFNALMALPNLLAIFILSSKSKKYHKNKKNICRNFM